MHCLTSIIPGETLYSWAATNHFLSGNRNSEAIGSQLLSAPHAVRQHDFPHSIASFIDVSGENTRTLLDILREHSIAGFYLPFFSEIDQLFIASLARLQQTVHWSRKLLGSSRSQKAAHPLKWCECCVDEDLQSFGRPYWHSVHQFPTSLRCDKHDIPLSWSKSASKKWRLPHTVEGVTIAIPEGLTQTAQTVAAVSACIQKISSIDMFMLRQATLVRLKEIGIIHSFIRAKHDRLAHWFTSTKSCELARFALPQLTQLVDGTSIPRLLWRQKKKTAISWVMLWSALDWQNAEEATQSFITAAISKKATIRSQMQLFDDLEVGQGCAPQHVQDAFKSCDSYAQVMQRLGVSRHDVIRWLEGDPRLRQDWKARLRQGKENECAEHIKRYAKESNFIGRVDIENNCSAEVRWLREHAPQRLTALLNSVPNRSSKQTFFQY